MRKVIVKIVNKNEKLPKYVKEGDSGMDLMANEDAYIRPGNMVMIKTGVFVEITEPYFEIQVRSRSGLAYKHQIFVLNSPGTIDNGYRNEIGVLLYNAGSNSFQVKKGDRIAQAVLCPIYKIKWEEVEKLSDSDRGLGGFGSTGI